MEDAGKGTVLSDDQIIKQIVDTATQAYNERLRDQSLDIKHFKSKYEIIAKRYPIVLYFIMINKYSATALRAHILNVIKLTEANNFWWKDEMQFANAQLDYIERLYKGDGYRTKSKKMKKQMAAMRDVIKDEHTNVLKAYEEIENGNTAEEHRKKLLIERMEKKVSECKMQSLYRSIADGGYADGGYAPPSNPGA